MYVAVGRQMDEREVEVADGGGGEKDSPPPSHLRVLVLRYLVIVLSTSTAWFISAFMSLGTASTTITKAATDQERSLKRVTEHFFQNHDNAGHEHSKNKSERQYIV